MRCVNCNGFEIKYLLERKKVKNINLRIRQNGDVYVSAPNFVNESEIDDFVRLNASKIMNAKKRFAQMNKSLPEFKSGESVSVLGKKYKLKIMESNYFSFSFCGSVLCIEMKNCNDFESRRGAYDKVLRAVAEKEFPEIVNNCCFDFIKYHQSTPHLKIRKMKGQWGNCRSKSNVITLNSRLAAYDKKVIEFVVIHELCHFVQPNHSPDFYSLLSSVLPDWRVCYQVLKNK